MLADELVSKQMRAFATNATEYFPHIVYQVAVEDWLNQLYLAKMPGTVDLRASTSFTKSVLVHRAHQVIVNTMRDWVPIGLVNIILINGLDSHPINFLAA